MVRAMTEADLGEAEALCVRVHKYPRTGELRDALRGLAPYVALRDGRITAYVTAVANWHLNHGVAETEADLQDVITGASRLAGEPFSLLLPIRQAALHRWSLQQGMRMVKPMTLMTMGDYQEPRGAWYPSVLY